MEEDVGVFCVSDLVSRDLFECLITRRVGGWGGSTDVAQLSSMVRHGCNGSWL